MCELTHVVDVLWKIVSVPFKNNCSAAWRKRISPSGEEIGSSLRHASNQYVGSSEYRIARSKAETYVSCHISAVASCLWSERCQSNGKKRTLIGSIPLAPQIDHICLNTSRNLDIDTNIYSWKCIETADLAAVWSVIRSKHMKGQSSAPVTSIFDFPGCTLREPRVAIFYSVC